MSAGISAINSDATNAWYVALVCPRCGSHRLRSYETAKLGYPVTMHRDPDGDLAVGYTGGETTCSDEDTQFGDELRCRECDWNGRSVELVDAAPVTS